MPERRVRSPVFAVWAARFPKQQTARKNAAQGEPSPDAFQEILWPTPIPLQDRPIVNRRSSFPAAKGLLVPWAAVRDQRRALPRELPALLLRAQAQSRAGPHLNAFPARHRQ